MKKLAWVSLLNDNSVSAYCSELLVPELINNFDIELFSPKGGELNGREVKNLAQLGDWSGEILYQIENSKDCEEIKNCLLKNPGVGIFHDVLLPAFYPDSPLAIKELNACKAVITCVERNRSDAINALGDNKTPTHLLPYPVKAIEPKDSQEFQICFSATANIEHRANKLLQALGPKDKLIWLINEDEKEQANKLLGDYRIKNAKLVYPRSPKKWREIVSESSLAVHTHFSAFGQPEPYLSISLMAGLPSIVHNFSSSELLPNSVVFKIEPGDKESVQIADIISSIKSGFDNSVIRAYASEQHDHQGVATQLKQIFAAI